MHKKLITIFSPTLLSLLIGITSLTTLITPSTASAAAPCKLQFTVTADKSAATVGQTITRTVTLKNLAKTSCHSVSYSMYYPSSEAYVSALPAPTASNYYWNIGTLNSGKSISATITTRVLATTDTQTTLEGCASATGAGDACIQSSVSITSTSTVITNPLPVATTTTAVPTTPAATTTPTAPVSNQKENGIWVWNFPSQMDTTIGTGQLQQLAKNGFTSIYLTVDDYLDIASMQTGTQKDTAKAAYFAHVAHVVQKANSLGIQVDAEGGWRDWAYQANRWKGFALIDMVKEYNAAYPTAKLRGFQYDVEPYILPEYETNKAQVLTDYVSFIDQSITRLVGTDITFSIVIPHFYDDVNQWTPKITYSGVSKYTYNHLLAILEKKQGSQIFIMAYRDFFEGTNGTRDVSETEVKEASNGFHTQVVIAQETGDVDPAYVTYYGTSKSAVMSALTTIQTAYKGYAGFGGVATHYMDSFFALP